MSRRKQQETTRREPRTEHFVPREARCMSVDRLKRFRGELDSEEDSGAPPPNKTRPSLTCHAKPTLNENNPTNSPPSTFTETLPPSEEWTTVTSKKEKRQEARAAQQDKDTKADTTTNTQTAPHIQTTKDIPTGPPKIIVTPTQGFETAVHLAEIVNQKMKRERGVKCNQMKFLTSGHVLLTPPDQEAAEYLLNLKEIDGCQINLKATGQETSKGVLLKYPVLMPLGIIEKHPLVLQATRCRIRTGEPTRQVEITVKGPLPGSLDLEEWGTFYTRPYSREPLRCFRCQRFGHHRNSCTLPPRCGVCAGPHDTTLCIQKHKGGQDTTAKCPNCMAEHHAWNRSCTARTTLVDAQKTTQQSFMLKHRPALAATSTWGQRNLATAATPQTPLASTNSHEFPALGHGIRRRNNQPQIRLQAPVPTRQVPTPETEEHFMLTKTDLKDLLTTFAGAIAGMLGQTIQEETLVKVADNVVEKTLQKRSSHNTAKTQPQQQKSQSPTTAPGATPATAAIEAEKKALGIQTTAPTRSTTTTRSQGDQTTPLPQQKPTPQPTDQTDFASCSGTYVAFEDGNIC